MPTPRPNPVAFRRLPAVLAAAAFALAAVAAPAPAQDAPAPKPEEPKAPAQPGEPVPPPDAPVSKPPVVPKGSPESPPQGAARESMWVAPTAEDWKRPCAITWQRTWEDAVAVSRETKRPILICINMDGEIASEHYAGVRYRQPEIAALYKPYVTVISSVYRHTPRDYDDDGNRIECPRFGSVTCGEHIQMETVAFEKYLDGVRVAPRHIMVELDGKESFDVYYANDTKSVFDQIQRGLEERPGGPPAPVVKGDRPIVERVASRDLADRQAVEAAYRQGDATLRKSILEAAAANRDAAPTEILRLAVFGLDPEMSKLARAALAQTDSTAAADLIADSLRVPMDDAEREKLLGALDRLGEKSRKAQWLAVVHRGLSAQPGGLDVAGWSKAFDGGTPAPGAGSYAAASDWFAMEAQHALKTAACRARPDDAAARLDLADSCFQLAREAPRVFADDPRAAATIQRGMYDDARQAALDAERLGAKDWRTDMWIALVAYREGGRPEAYERAEKAAKAMPPGETSWESMAVLTVFAESRFASIKQAVREKKRWPPAWLADLHASYSVLLHHPLASDAQIVWYYDFLDWLRAADRAARFLDEGVDRFPGSAALHERLRTRVLRDRGPDGLESAYEALLAKPGADPALWSYGGLASLAAAEAHRRAGAADRSEAAYDRALARFDRAAEATPAALAWIDRQAALVLAGRARTHYQLDRDDRALADLLASFARDPRAAGDRDGLGVTPGETAQMLLSRLRERQKLDDATRLAEAMASLDPELLRFDRGLEGK